MSSRDYYRILGVSPEATTEEIKSAFRRLALELHPDRSGADSGPFREVLEAYGVLSDPERRRAYDQQRQRQARERRSWRSRAEPLIRRRAAEPFQPGSSGWSPAAMAGPGWGTMTPGLRVLVPLTPAEARRGGRMWVEAPLRVVCPDCHGRGRRGWNPCWSCGGTGRVNQLLRVPVSWPPGTQTGHTVRLSLGGWSPMTSGLTVVFVVHPMA